MEAEEIDRGLYIEIGGFHIGRISDTEFFVRNCETGEGGHFSEQVLEDALAAFFYEHI